MIPPARHRWFRFRLHTLLIVVALVAVPLAWVAMERRVSWREQDIARQLRDLGIRGVELGGPYDSWELGLKGKGQTWWRNLAGRILGQRIVAIKGFPSDYTNLAQARLFFARGARVVGFSSLCPGSCTEPGTIKLPEAVKITPAVRLDELYTVAFLSVTRKVLFQVVQVIEHFFRSSFLAGRG